MTALLPLLGYTDPAAITEYVATKRPLASDLQTIVKSCAQAVLDHFSTLYAKASTEGTIFVDRSTIPPAPRSLIAVRDATSGFLTVYILLTRRTKGGDKLVGKGSHCVVTEVLCLNHKPERPLCSASAEEHDLSRSLEVYGCLGNRPPCIVECVASATYEKSDIVKTRLIMPKFRSFNTIFRRAVYDGTLPPLKDAIKWLEQLLTALDTLHQKGYRHGDAKAANMLLDQEGNLKLCDLNVLRMDLLHEAKERVTTGHIVSPEEAALLVKEYQYQSDHKIAPLKVTYARDLDTIGPKADAWAAGVFAASLLLGWMPITEAAPYNTREEWTVMEAFVALPQTTIDTEVDKKALPEGIAPIIKGLLAKTPDERLSVAEALVKVRELNPSLFPAEAAPGAALAGAGAPMPAAAACSGAGGPPRRLRLEPRSLVVVPAAEGGYKIALS